jgi:SulP family sulfate permease
MPSLRLPDVPLSAYVRLLPSALAIVSITLAEGLLLVRKYSRKYGYEADGNQVLFAYGMANVAGGLTGGLVISNSASRAAAMDGSGAKSQVPSLVAAVAVALALLFFADLLALLPTAALAGIVANAVISLIEVHEFRELWRVRRSDFWIATVCLVSVLVLGPLQAVIIAFLLSTIDVVRRASRPRTSVLKEVPDGTHLAAGSTDIGVTAPGLIVYRFEASLYFANANLFLDQVEQLVSRAPSPVKWFVLDAQAIVDIDTTGAEALEHALALLEERNVTFVMSRANEAMPSLLERYGLMARMDKQRMYSTNREAVAAFYQEQEEPVPERLSEASDSMP